LVRLLDRNGDGLLDQEEADRLPRQFVLPGFAGGDQAPDLNLSLQFSALDKNSDGKLTSTELADYYRANGALAVPFRYLRNDLGVGGSGRGFPQPPMAPSGAELSEALFRHLDTNKDGKLSRSELVMAGDLLRKLDTDEDEVISPSEL